VNVTGSAPEGLTVLAEGTVTTPRGFTAGGVHVGVRSDWDKLDVGLLYSEAPCVAAAVYTSNRLPGASLVISREHLKAGRAQAVVANSGCANAATGRRGLDDAIRMAQLAGARLGIDPHLVVVASTGVIGTYLPMDRIARGIEAVELSSEPGGMDFLRAIMTTDSRPKHVAAAHGGWTIGGVVKGAGMIHPNLATMLCFITTDAPVQREFLQDALRRAVDVSFNMIDIDSDTSPDDIVLVMANGLAGGEPIAAGDARAEAFEGALTYVCTHLAKAVCADAEGGTKVIEAVVQGAATLEDARRAAREVVKSVGVKTAVYGKDPNWGRILSAVGNSGAEVDESRIRLYLRRPGGGEVCVFENGAAAAYDQEAAKACMAPPEVGFRIDLGLGGASATAWGSDLTEEFVRLNSEYTT
jgi:glutamate N-acetyltransferase/amino-acid N-acetyltransferase